MWSAQVRNQLATRVNLICPFKPELLGVVGTSGVLVPPSSVGRAQDS